MFLRKHFAKGTEPANVVEDICDNLSNVLRTKRGCGYFMQSFGLSDVGYRTPEEMVTNLTAEITENIRLFEPRVELIGVDEEYADSGERAKLLVNLRMRGATEKLAIVIDLQKNSIDVRPVGARRAPK